VQKDVQKQNDFKSWSFNRQAAEILAELHSHLYGPQTISHNGKNYRSSIIDSRKFLIFRCITVNAMEVELKKWTDHIGQFGLSKQAIIVMVGQTYSAFLDQFFVLIDDITYKMEGETSLISAIYLLLQIYYVFDIEYPIMNSNVYEFLAKQFLGLQSSTKKKSKKGNKVEALYNTVMNSTG
jgi:hypothetical protein